MTTVPAWCWRVRDPDPDGETDYATTSERLARVAEEYDDRRLTILWGWPR